MLRPPSQDQPRRLSGDHLRRGICGPGDDTGHDGSVGDPEMLQPVHAQFRVDNGETMSLVTMSTLVLSTFIGS
jgi:hypothetical protein